MSDSTLFFRKTPLVPLRALHLDLKGVPPTPKRLLDLIPIAKLGRYNAFLVEWEDMFPWTVDVRFRCKTAYTESQIREFTAACSRAGIEIIPLVQCLGHMETPLSLPEYKKLREVPYQSDVLNALAPGARRLVESMIDDVLRLMPDVRRFHLGGDEAWSFGSHPQTKAYIRKYGKGALYLQHIEPLLDKLNNRSIRPILWHDMMREWDNQALRRLATKADLCVWGYQGHPRNFYLINEEMLERFKKQGITMWAGTAYKGADGQSVDRPNIPEREKNTLGWTDLIREYSMKGAIATAWSRYNTCEVQCEPIDGCLDALIDIGAILHDGRLTGNSLDSSVNLLKTIGEKERFLKCRDALIALTRTRNEAGRAIIGLKEICVMSRTEPRRAQSGFMTKKLGHLKKRIQDLEMAGIEFKKAFRDSIPETWADAYVRERIIPSLEDFNILEKQVRKLDPVAYRLAYRKTS